MEETQTQNQPKVAVAFKCPPPLKVFLTDQAKQLDVTLSSLIETRLLAEEVRERELIDQSQKIKTLEEQISFYEQATLLQNLYKEYKGRDITYTTSNGQKINQKIETVKDVFTVIISTFKTNK